MLTAEELWRLARARALLRTPGEERPSIRSVARSSGLSVSHFIRCFRAVFGETPHRATATQTRAVELGCFGLMAGLPEP